MLIFCCSKDCIGFIFLLKIEVRVIEIAYECIVFDVARLEQIVKIGIILLTEDILKRNKRFCTNRRYFSGCAAFT